MAEKTRIRALFVAEESTFAVDPDATGAAYKYLHAEASLPGLGYEVIESALQNDRLVRSIFNVGAAKATLSLKIPLRASGTPATSTVTAIASETDLLLQHVFGTVTRGVGSAVQAGGSGATVNVASSAGFVVGGLVYSTAKSAFFVVKTKPTGTSVTVEPTPATDITSGDLVAASYYTPADSGHKSLAFAVKVGSVLVTLLGCKVSSVKVSGIAAGSIPTLEVGFDADSWTTGAKASLPAADDLFPSVKPPKALGAPVYIDGVATLTSGVDLDLGVKAAFLPSTEGTNGRSGFEVVDRQISGSLAPYYAAGYLTDHGSATAKRLAFACGSQSTGWGFYIPVAAWKAHEMAEAEGVLGNKVGFEAFDNGTSPEIVLSVF